MLYELVPLNRGYGNFSVSMAVQNSTLKKRIETMPYHYIYKTSLKRSVLFLLTMIIAVTVPIACSDLRGPGAIDVNALEKSTLQLNDLQVYINSVEIQNNATEGVSTSGLGAILINAEKYGIFKVAPRSFKSGTRAGFISDNTLSFRINEMKVTVTSADPILTGFNETEIWVEHVPIDTKYFSIGVITDANSETPPPPPFSKNLTEDTDDYFVVVEEMPKLIGGLKGLQSKVVYPEMAKRAGIEGRVTLQFIVNENGDVENPKVIRGIGGGADEAALQAVSEAKFEPGIQRGKPVRVQFSLPVVFKLTDSEFTDAPPKPSSSK